MVQSASISRMSNFALVARKMVAAIFTVTTVLLPITPALASNATLTVGLQGDLQNNSGCN